MAFTNVEVDKVNDIEFHKLCQKGAPHTTIRAIHTTGVNDDDVLPDIVESLQNTISKEYDSAVINLAIGTRCRCTQNLSPQLGKTKTLFFRPPGLRRPTGWWKKMPLSSYHLSCRI